MSIFFRRRNIKGKWFVKRRIGKQSLTETTKIRQNLLNKLQSRNPNFDDGTFDARNEKSSYSWWFFLQSFCTSRASLNNKNNKVNKDCNKRTIVPRYCKITHLSTVWYNFTGHSHASIRWNVNYQNT